MEDHDEVVQVLVDKGADVNAKNVNNFTALLYALIYENESLADILKQHGAKE